MLMKLRCLRQLKDEENYRKDIIDEKDIDT